MAHAHKWVAISKKLPCPLKITYENRGTDEERRHFHVLPVWYGDDEKKKLKTVQISKEFLHVSHVSTMSTFSR